MLEAIQHPVVRLAATTAFMMLGGDAEARYGFMLKEDPMAKRKGGVIPPGDSKVARKIIEHYTTKATEHLISEAPTVRLAHVPGAQGDNNLIGQRGVEQLPEELAPALLVSFVYLEMFERYRHRYIFRDWVLDSGAFSARRSGKEIDLQEYIKTCKRLLATDDKLTEVFSLDVIGDHKATIKNTEKMWDAGVPAIPCYHLREPDSALKHYAKTYPKIALGGMADLRGDIKMEYASQCFARVWPKKIHGFGAGSEKMIMGLPWHSTDSTNWEIGPCRFGRWVQYGNIKWRGSSQNLRAEVEWYLALERKARSRWRKEMEMLEAEGPDVRLVYSTGGDGKVSELALQPKGAKLKPRIKKAAKAKKR